MTRRPRKHIPIAEIAASALADRLPVEQLDQLRAAKVPAAKILRMFTPDHAVLHALGGADKWWNLTMRMRGPELKAKDNRDTGIVAKVRRLEDHQEASRRAILRPCGQKRKPKASIRSAGFDKSKTKKMDGRVVTREARS